VSDFWYVRGHTSLNPVMLKAREMKGQENGAVGNDFG